jgi:phosphoribosyl 1,2-cyclic phosphate phosphodiesterase
MEILFLGTSAAEGIPALFCRCETCLNAEKSGTYDLRSRCGYLINRHFMIDITQDILLHKRLYNLDLAAVATWILLKISR